MQHATDAVVIDDNVCRRISYVPSLLYIDVVAAS